MYFWRRGEGRESQSRPLDAHPFEGAHVRREGKEGRKERRDAVVPLPPLPRIGPRLAVKAILPSSEEC